MENNLQEMYNYVEKRLIEAKEEYATKKVVLPFRKRSEHIYRVYTWTKRLIEESNLKLNKEALFIASIFHDSGYAIKNDLPHAINSGTIFREYIKDHEVKDIELIEYLIVNHSNKGIMHDPNSLLELVVLQEADLLDETGAMSILWDAMVEGQNEVQSFFQTYEHIKRNTLKDLYKMEMRTDVAKKYWQAKRELVNKFLESLECDLVINKE